MRLPVIPRRKETSWRIPRLVSIHNRGCAVDLTLYNLETGKEYNLETGKGLEMPSSFDEMTERAKADYAGGTSQQSANREGGAQAHRCFSVAPSIDATRTFPRSIIVLGFRRPLALRIVLMQK